MKIKSMELPGSVIVDFEDNGKIHLHNKWPLSQGDVVKISTTELETIRTTARNNGKAEAGNGIETVNEKKEKV